MNAVKKGMMALRKGVFVLVYDADGREEETDLVIASQFVTPEAIRILRTDGGGLICTTISPQVREMLGIPYLYRLFSECAERYPVLNELAPYDIPYDTKSSFAITINHRKTFTGITDIDRAMTIKEFARFVNEALSGKKDARKEFGRLFRSPGHVTLLNASNLSERQGHTELATALVMMAGLTPSATICEMLAPNGKARSKTDAIKYAKEHNLVFLEGFEIVELWKKGVKEWSE